MDITQFFTSHNNERYSNRFQPSFPNFQARLEQTNLFESLKNNSSSDFLEPSAFFSFNHEEDNAFRNPDDYLLQDSQQQNQPSPMADYPKDYFQGCELQTTNFYPKIGFNQSQNYSGPTYPNLWGCNEEKEVINNQDDVKENIEPNVNSHVANQPVDQNHISIPSFEGWNPLVAFSQLRVNSSMSMSESTNACDNIFCHSPVELRNQRRKSQTTQPKAKKKRKTNVDDIKQEHSEMSPPALKLKKSKSEFDQVAFPISAGPNLLSLYTEIPNSQGNNNVFSSNPFSSCSQNHYPDHSWEKDERNENSTDISSCISSYPKLEDSPNLMKNAYPMNYPQVNQNQPMGIASYDLSEKVIFPVNMKEYFSNQEVGPTNQISEAKRIGLLTIEERQAKIEKYRQKRKQRSWNKKISYDCRKRVADGRLRIRGRFVTKSRAFAILDADGVAYDPNKITMAEIKEYLDKKFMDHSHDGENEKKTQFEEEFFNFEKKEEDGNEAMFYDIPEDFEMSPLRSDDGKCGFPYNCSLKE